MTVEEIKKAIVALDPYTVVKADLDCFAPYAYFDLPHSISIHIESLSEDEEADIVSFMDDYLCALQSRGTAIAWDELDN